MDQQKIGLFLKELRNQKGATQEQTAEIFHVSNRTVSRWENGYNMPDLDVLIEISDYYKVDLRELLDGERKNNKMDKETEETVLKAVEYTNADTERHNNRIHWLLLTGIILLAVSKLIGYTSLVENVFLKAVSAFADGLACGLIICGSFATSMFGKKLKAYKQRIIKKIIIRS